MDRKNGGNKMKETTLIYRVAGTMAFISGLGSLIHHPYWGIIGIIVGLNLFQFSWSGFCPLTKVLKRLKVPLN